MSMFHIARGSSGPHENDATPFSEDDLLNPALT
jgi:hypothetical protein